MYEVKKQLKEAGYDSYVEENKNVREPWMDLADNFLINTYLPKKKIYEIINCAVVDDYTDLDKKHRTLAVKLNIAFSKDVPVNLFIDYVEAKLEERKLVNRIKKNFSRLLSNVFKNG